jgi:hypothetical protein
MTLLAALRNSFTVRDAPGNKSYHRITQMRKNRRNHRGRPTVHPENGDQSTEDILETAHRRVVREEKRLVTKENCMTLANKKKVSQLLAMPLVDSQMFHSPNGHETELLLEVIHDSVTPAKRH